MGNSAAPAKKEKVVDPEGVLHAPLPMVVPGAAGKVSKKSLTGGGAERKTSLGTSDVAYHMIKDAMTTHTRILDWGLYLGNKANALDAELMSKAGIKHFVQVHAGDPIPIADGAVLLNIDTGSSGSLRKNIEVVMKFINEGRKAGSGVLLFCEEGRVFSPALATAYIMAHFDWRHGRAMEFVRSKRAWVSFSDDIVAELVAYEKELFAEE